MVPEPGLEEISPVLEEKLAGSEHHSLAWRRRTPGHVFANSQGGNWNTF